jgi:hypothetical protein
VVRKEEEEERGSRRRKRRKETAGEASPFRKRHSFAGRFELLYLSDAIEP